jgi:hypothetical protein
MTDSPDLASMLAELSAPSRPVDTHLLGEVRHGLEQIPDEGPATAGQGGDPHPDVAIRRTR